MHSSFLFPSPSYEVRGAGAVVRPITGSVEWAAYFHGGRQHNYTGHSSFSLKGREHIFVATNRDVLKGHYRTRGSVMDRLPFDQRADTRPGEGTAKEKAMQHRAGIQGLNFQSGFQQIVKPYLIYSRLRPFRVDRYWFGGTLSPAP